MFGILAIMFLSIILPAFVVKPGHSANSQYVVAIESGQPALQQTLLNYLELLLKRDILSKPHVAVVILGNGLSILQADNGQYLIQIRKLQTSGVEFYLCRRSLQQNARKHPGITELADGFRQVEDGASYVNCLMDEGYINDFA